MDTWPDLALRNISGSEVLKYLSNIHNDIIIDMITTQKTCLVGHVLHVTWLM